MTKDSRILQKRLSIESLLNDVVSLPTDEDGGGGEEDTHSKRKRYCEEIEHRLVFVGNLLSAEIASGKPPNQLRHIGRRLLELRKDFYEWKKKGKEVITQKEGSDNEAAESVVKAEEAVEEDESEEEERELLPAGSFVRVFASGVVAGMGLMGFLFVRYYYRGGFYFVDRPVVSFSPT